MFWPSPLPWLSHLLPGDGSKGDESDRKGVAGSSHGGGVLNMVVRRRWAAIGGHIQGFVLLPRHREIFAPGRGEPGAGLREA
jgi:hypothetical protein